MNCPECSKWHDLVEDAEGRAEYWRKRYEAAVSIEGEDPPAWVVAAIANPWRDLEYMADYASGWALYRDGIQIDSWIPRHKKPSTAG